MTKLRPQLLRVLELLARRGSTNRQIAEVLGTTEQTVKNYVHYLLDWSGQDSRVQLVVWWMKYREPYRQQFGIPEQPSELCQEAPR